MKGCIVLLCALLVLGEDEGAVGHRPLDRQLDRLRDLTVRFRAGHPDLFGRGGLARERPVLSGTSPPERLVERLRRELDLLEQTVALLEEDAALAAIPISEAYARTVNGVQERWTVVLGANDVLNESLLIENVGDVTVEGPRIVTDGHGTWRDVAAVLEDALAGASTDREKAEALWAFLVRHRRHGAPPVPRREVRDPVKMLSVYGYGFCGDAARVYATLAERAGLEARVWGLDGHVVPEVRVDGGWRLYDPDGEVYFRRDDGEVASLADVVACPELLETPELVPGRARAQYGTATLRRVFARPERHALKDVEVPATPHRMDIRLRPGESVRWSWRHRGLYVPAEPDRPPPRWANGEWSHRVEVAPDAVFPVEIPFHLPWPILHGSVVVRFPDIGSRGDWVVQVRVGEGPWQDAGWGRSANRLFPAELPRLAATDGGPAYDVTIRLHKRHPEASGVVDWIAVDLVFQHAPLALPALGPGENEIVFRSDTPEGVLALRHTYREMAGP